MILITKTSHQTRQTGHTLFTCVQFSPELWVPCDLTPAFLLFSRLSGLAGTGLILFFLRFFLFPPKYLQFPHGVYKPCAISCTSSLPHPPRFCHRSRSYTRPYSQLHYCSRFRARARVCVFVFIKLHITAQSGPGILVILCVCVCVCVFIKLYITAQSGPVIYSFYATACNPPGGYLS